METLLVLFYVFCYFVFGIKGARRFVDNKFGASFQTPEKRWERYAAIAIAALGFAYIEFGRLLILGILKVVSFMTGNW